MEPDFLTVIIGREQVEAGDIKQPLSALQKLLNCNTAIRFRERVEIGVDGYNDDQRELHEIEEVRKFIHMLDAEFPFWLYFLTKDGTGLNFILSCFCPPFLTPEARRRIWPESIQQYLLKRGFPAMNQLCELTGCSEKEIELLTGRVSTYLAGVLG